MNPTIESLKSRLRSVERDLEARLIKSRRQFEYSLVNGKAVFTRAARKRHAELKKSLVATLADARVRNLIAAPFIYAVFFPIAVLDVFVSMYQAICFRLWRIPLVRRSEYVIVDRHRLPYLNAIQKLNCAYCGYANGVMSYVSEVAARTEQYWCPIKHALSVKQPHGRYLSFIEYGDANDLQNRIGEQRDALCCDDQQDTSNTKRLPICEAPLPTAAD